MLRTVLAVCICALLVSAQDQSSKSARVRAEMRNVVYHFNSAVAVHIVYLQGDLVPTPGSRYPIFDDVNSFYLDVRAGQITVSTAALTDVLNRYAFNSQDAPLKNLRMAVRNGKLEMSGHLRKANLPFESQGSLSLTPEGKIRVHSENIKAAHLPVKGLMDLLGENISKLIDTQKVRGVSADKDDLILDPAELFPPPHLHGQLSSIAIHGDEVVLKYGGAFTPAFKLSGNYMAYRGAQLQFGKLLMSETDLTLIDLNPEDPFDLFFDHYREQMAAGYTKITASFALRSYFRDYNKLGVRREKP